jgi:hypothetical protein
MMKSKFKLVPFSCWQKRAEFGTAIRELEQAIHSERIANTDDVIRDVVVPQDCDAKSIGYSKYIAAQVHKSEESAE